MATIDPFGLKPEKIRFRDWKQLAVRSYDKREADPYTRVRSILMNGTEFEAQWFKHNYARHCTDNELRRELALSRRVEQQQQKAIAALKPADENLLEHTIGYEQLAVDLTAIMAQNEPDGYVKAALDFALLEDFDHLYRFSDLLEMEQGEKGEALVGGYTEIMPGRPTVAHHRHPCDDVRRFAPNKLAAPLTKLHTMIITAAEQQTMNYYMNLGSFYKSDAGRKLFTEVAMVEEQHVTQYGSLIDPSATWAEMNLLHEYAECYLYYSMYEDETDAHVKALWDRHFADEVTHLHMAAEILERYEHKHWQQVIPCGTFPALLSFNANVENNKAYVRKVLRDTVDNAAMQEDYTTVSALPDDYRFFAYNDAVNDPIASVASHAVINEYIGEFGEDYRFQESEHPVPELRDRTRDNTHIGR